MFGICVRYFTTKNRTDNSSLGPVCLRWSSCVLVGEFGVGYPRTSQCGSTLGPSQTAGSRQRPYCRVVLPSLRRHHRSTAEEALGRSLQLRGDVS
eukprot:4770615-Amphidinium_carterae.1